MRKRNRRLIRKRLTSILCLSLVFLMVSNPMATVLFAVAESPLLDNMGRVSATLVHMAEHLVTDVLAEESSESGESGGTTIINNYNCNCDLSAIESSISSLESSVSSNSSAISSNAANISALDTKVNSIEEALTQQINDVKADAENKFNSLTSLISTESASMQTSVNAQGASIITAINSNGSSLQTVIKDESKTIQETMKTYCEDYLTAEGMTVTQWTQQIDTDMNEGFKDVKEELKTANKTLNKIYDKLSDIYDAIIDISHAYKVAEIHCINSTNDEILWKPKLEDIPYAEDIAYNTIGYANVYTGFWGAEEYTGNGELGYQSVDYKYPVRFGNITNNNCTDDMRRAISILGRDIIVNADGYMVSGNINDGYSTVYTKQYINSDAVTWSDVVGVLYKALGEYKVSYTAYTLPTPANIVVSPIDSPLSQGLSNITHFDTSEYYFNIFFSRSSYLEQTVKEDGSIDVKKHDYYWEKALNDGLVKQSQDPDAAIYGVDFIKLASRIMHLYGEPVLSQNEVDQLLQVYGLQFPIQMGLEIADAWAYLKVRGVLNKYVDYSGTVDAETLLNTAMCIKDKDSRSDYKNIAISMDLADVLISDGYYPVEDLNFSKGGFNISDVMDYTVAVYYDYYIALTDETIGTYKGNYLKDTGGGILENIYIAAKEGTGAATDATFVGIEEDSNRQKYYHIKVQKGTARDITIVSKSGTDANATTLKVTIPEGQLGGGVYRSFTTVNGTEGIVTTAAGRIWFDNMSQSENDKEWIYCVDGKRSGEINSSVALHYDPTILDYVSFAFDYMFTPDTVNAALISGESNGQFQLSLSPGEDATKDEFVSVTQGEAGLAMFVARMNSFCNYTHPSNEIAYKGVGIWSFFLANAPYSNVKTEDQCRDAFKAIYSYFESANSRDAGLTKKGIGEIYGSKFSSFVDHYGILLWDLTWADYETTRKPSTNPKDFSNTETEYLSGPGAWYSIKDDESYKKAKAATLEQIPLMWKALNSGKMSGMSKSNGGNGSPWCVDIKYVGEKGSKEEACLKEIFGQATLNTNLENGVPEPAFTDISVSMASSAVMNRSENILISWDDLLKSGMVIDTFNQKMPSPADDGIFYIQTQQEQVKVNPNKYTILIGTTFYNLMRPDGSGPQLVYIDSEQEMVYFDYRCIMGLNAVEVVRTGDKVKVSDNSIGSGQGVIYTLGSNGASSSLMSTSEVIVRHYPDFYDKNNESVDAIPWKTSYITETKFDGDAVEDSQGVYESFDYAVDEDGNSINLHRISLSSFIPTANWLVVIDDTGDTPKAKLFVWYLKHAFADNKRGITIDINKVNDQGVAEFDVTSYSTLKGDNGAKTLSSFLNKIYGTSQAFDTLPNYDKMTIEAATQLYDMTDGGFALSPNYVMRSFDITDNTILNAPNEWEKADADGNKTINNANDEGAIYWVDGIGYVYNVPTLKDGFAEDYYEGKYPLPLVWADAGELSGIDDDMIININTDYYAEIKGSSTYEGFGYVVGAYGIGDVFSISSDSLGILEKYDISPVFKSEPTDINLGVKYSLEGSNFAMAPVGLYNFFGGDKGEYLTSGDLGAYETNTNFVYLGTQRLKYDSNSKDTTNPDYFRASGLLNTVKLNSSQKFYQVLYNPMYRVYVCSDAELAVGEVGRIQNVIAEGLNDNQFDDLFAGKKIAYLLDMIDNATTWWIVVCFTIIPLIGIILMTILIGLSFLCDVRVFKMLAEKIVDPVYILTFGARDVNTWHWRTVLIPCCLMYASFALVLNGNLLRVIQWLMEWFGFIVNSLNTIAR